MGRTVPSFRMAQVAEFRSWSRFRTALPRSERRSFDEMLDEARFHTSASSMAVRGSVFEGVFMAILLHHREQLDELLDAEEGDGTALPGGEVVEELRSWEGFANALRAEERACFERMIASALENAPAIQARSSPFPVEGLFMATLLSQHRLIERLKRENEELRGAALG